MQQFQYILFTSSSKLLNNIGITLGPVFDNIREFIVINSVALGKEFSKHIVNAFAIGNTIAVAMNKIKTAFISGFKFITEGVSTYIKNSKFANDFAEKVGKKTETFMASLVGSWLGAFGKLKGVLKWIGNGLMKLVGLFVTGLTWLAGALTAVAKVIVLPIAAIVAVAAAAYQVGQWISNMVIQWKLMKPWQTDTSLSKWLSEKGPVKSLMNWIVGVNEEADAKKLEQMNAEAKERYANRLKQVQQINNLVDNTLANIVNVTLKRAGLSEAEKMQFDLLKANADMQQNWFEYQKIVDKLKGKANNIGPQAAKELAQKAQETADAYVQAMESVSQIQQKMYDFRKQQLQKQADLNKFTRDAMQYILELGDNKKLTNRFKLSNIFSEIFDLRNLRSKLQGQDAIQNLQKQNQLIRSSAQIRIEGIKEEISAAKEFRNWIIEIGKKITQFRTSSINAIDVNTAEGYRFQTSMASPNILSDALRSNANEMNSLDQKLYSIQQDQYSALSDILKQIKFVKENGIPQNYQVISL